MTNKLELIDKVKQIDWLKKQRKRANEYMAVVYDLVIEEIERGTFDIKEPIQEEGEKTEQ